MLIAIIPQVLHYTGFITASENGGINMLNQAFAELCEMEGLVIFCGVLAFTVYLLFNKYTLKSDKLKKVREKILLIHKQ